MLTPNCPTTKIQTVLTDHGTPFTGLVHADRGAEKPSEARHLNGFYLMHTCDAACEQPGNEPRLTKPGHPWTNGLVERMNRTLKDATVTQYDDESHQVFKEPLDNFVHAYHAATRLKTLHGLTPDAYIINYGQKDPERCHNNSCHHTVGLYI
jgi:transposase InsO family protein